MKYNACIVFTDEDVIVISSDESESEFMGMISYILIFIVDPVSQTTSCYILTFLKGVALKRD